MFNRPILLIIFNRVDSLPLLINVLRQIQPTKVYIAADGPRQSRLEDIDKCEQTRKLALDSIDWTCEIKTLFQEKNLGCGKAPATAISWFFENEDAGIILEDDCIPDISFFRFCDELLDKYKNDNRIMEICGTNRLMKWDIDNQSYYFSCYSSQWGWATWRRAWNLYDYNISTWRERKAKKIIRSLFPKGRWFDKISQWLDHTINYPDSLTWWDFQWNYCKNINSGLSIIPKYNLISNIGFTEEATHTFSKKDPFYNIKRYTMDFPLTHPIYICRDVDLDTALLNKNIAPRNLLMKYSKILYRKIKKWIKIIFHS